MENFKDLLTTTPIKYKSVVKVDITWGYYVVDYKENCHEDFNADEFFKDKKLIWSLAYLDMFGEDVENYEDEEELVDIDALYENLAVTHHLWRLVDKRKSSLEKLEITYYDENGNIFKVTFDDIHKRWKNMSKEEICEEVNDVLLDIRYRR